MRDLGIEGFRNWRIGGLVDGLWLGLKIGEFFHFYEVLQFCILDFCDVYQVVLKLWLQWRVAMDR